MQFTKEQNKELIEKYPFLKPKSRRTGKVREDYDYENTELDNMPDGWRIAFGEEMCAELKVIIEKHGAMEEYVILDIKEKYGELCWYDYGLASVQEYFDWEHKYRLKSRRTCIRCGNKATKISTGWISPYCDECATHLKSIQFVDLEEFYSVKNHKIAEEQ